MKLNKRGWGYRMMALLMSILVIALLVASYYIYRFYDRMKSDFNRVGIVEVVRDRWKKY